MRTLITFIFCSCCTISVLFFKIFSLSNMSLWFLQLPNEQQKKPDRKWPVIGFTTTPLSSLLPCWWVHVQHMVMSPNVWVPVVFIVTLYIEEAIYTLPSGIMSPLCNLRRKRNLQKRTGNCNSTQHWIEVQMTGTLIAFYKVTSSIVKNIHTISTIQDENKVTPWSLS